MIYSSLSLSFSPARRTLSFVLVAHIPAQYILWVFFALVFILFSVGFVQLVSIHAIGKMVHKHKFGMHVMQYYHILVIV